MYRYVVAPCFFANQLIRLRCILNPQNWVQETCLHIQAAALRVASLYFHRGLLMTIRFYLIVLSIAGLIMMRQIIHLPTFQPPVHDASFIALSLVKDFYRR